MQRSPWRPAQCSGGMYGLEARLLRAVAESQSPVESEAFAESAGVEHAAVVGLMKSLLTCDMIAVEVSRPDPSTDVKVCCRRINNPVCTICRRWWSPWHTALLNCLCMHS